MQSELNVFSIECKKNYIWESAVRVKILWEQSKEATGTDMDQLGLSPKTSKAIGKQEDHSLKSTGPWSYSPMDQGNFRERCDGTEMYRIIELFHQ